MNCRRAQSDIALWAGNDLDEPTLWELRNHLQACPPCRAYLDEMRALMRLVEECPLRNDLDETAKCAVAESLWPSLSSRLVTLPLPRRDHFNGWVPAVAVAAVCLAMVLIASPPQLLAPNDASTLSVSAEEALDVDSPAERHGLSMNSSGRLSVQGPLADMRRISPRHISPLANGIENWMNEDFPRRLPDGSLFFSSFENRENPFGQQQDWPRRSTVYVYWP